MDQAQIADFLNANPWVSVVLALWALAWKGTALWKAAGKKQISWFGIIMVFNTLGLLEIAYIFFLNKYELGSSKLLASLKSVFKK